MNQPLIQINPDKFEDNFTVGGELGRGQYAVVRQCVEKKTGKVYAAKFLRKKRRGRDCRHEVLHEAEILRLSAIPDSHPGIIKLHDVYECKHELVLLLELAAGGDLHKFCLGEFDDEPTRSEREIVYLLRQIIHGIRHLHHQNILHLDVKPLNLLLTSNTDPYPQVKIIDFGLARKIKDGEQVCLMVGTPDYVAPEVLEFDPVGKPSDMWSVGVVAYVLLTGMSPFSGDDRTETYYNICMGCFEFPDEYFDQISHTARDFIKRLLIRNPEERMDVDQALRHPWLCSEELIERHSLRQEGPRKHRNSCKRDEKRNMYNKTNNHLNKNMAEISIMG